MSALETATDYSIRWFTPADREPFIDLYNETFGGGSEEWFEWKYVDNPRVTHVPILVAEGNGEFAGARAQVPFLMRGGNETVDAMRFGDTMVHPDHRRRGVFSRLTERALEHYGRQGVRFCFNVPNDLSRPGFLKAGGEIVANLPSFYRVQTPSALGSAASDDATAALGRLAGPAARAYLDVRDSLAPAPDDVRVIRHDEIPTGTLAGLYERSIPDRVHAVRDEVFLDWRYQNPRWAYRAYTARVDGTPVAALVTGTQTDDHGVTTTNVVDVLPLGASTDRTRALRALLTAVTREYRHADLLAYCGTAISPALLREYGFHYDGGVLLDRVTTPTRLVAYDLGGQDVQPWTVGGVDIHDADGWGFSYVELDAR